MGNSKITEKYTNESFTKMTQMVMPNDTNPIGNLMGGNLMRWMDIAASMCAGKHCEAYVVTASIDHVSFQSPIKLGDVIEMEARVTRAFNTSVEIFVEVFAQDIKGKNRRKSNQAFFTFVAITDDTFKPKPVPKVVPVSDEENMKFEGANRRREIRLILSGRLKPEDAMDIKTYFADK